MPVIPKQREEHKAIEPAGAQSANASYRVAAGADDVKPASAARLYMFAGIALIAAGLLFGDIFAVFILHQNAGKQGAALIAASRAVAAGNSGEVNNIFAELGGVLEDRGTKVDAHVHMIDAGYLALLLALAQPYVLLSARTKKILAVLFIAAGALFPIGIFLIHYVGLAGSPFAAIGWASVVADSAGALLIFVLVAQLWGVLKYFREGRFAIDGIYELASDEDGMPRRALLSGGTILILLGFLQGAYYAGTMLYAHESLETSILQRIIDSSSSGQLSAAAAEVGNFGNLAGTRAVNIAAHSHIIEFGLLAILLSFVQSSVLLSDKWKRRWVKMFLGGSLILPVFVLLEVRFGLVAGGIADLGGLMVLIALIGMSVGILRHSGAREVGPTRTTGQTPGVRFAGSNKLLLVGGMLLAACGMLYGLHYALFVEHQTLDQMGGSLAQSFSAAASRNFEQSRTALQRYAETKYDYVRQVDAHSHWTGLAMLIFLLGVIFGRLNFRESNRLFVAVALLTGGIMFPLAVLLQTYNHGAFVWKAFSILGSGLIITALAATAWGFARPRKVGME